MRVRFHSSSNISMNMTPTAVSWHFLDVVFDDESNGVDVRGAILSGWGRNGGC